MTTTIIKAAAAAAVCDGDTDARVVGRHYFRLITYLFGRGQAELNAVHDSQGIRVVAAGALGNFFSDLKKTTPQGR